MDKAHTPYLAMLLSNLSDIFYVCEFIVQHPERVKSGPTRERGLPVVHSVDRIGFLPTCREETFCFEETVHLSGIVKDVAYYVELGVIGTASFHVAQETTNYDKCLRPFLFS